MNRCATCRWWQRDDKHDGLYDSDSGTIAQLTPEGRRFLDWDEEEKYIDEARLLPLAMCKSPKLVFFRLPSPGEAALLDGSEFHAEMITHADFGCVNHESAAPPHTEAP